MPDASLNPDAIPWPPTVRCQEKSVSVRAEHSQGGITWAASPQSITLPKNQLLQLLAENENGLDLSTCMQSSGYWTGSFNLEALSIHKYKR